MNLREKVKRRLEWYFGLTVRIKDESPENKTWKEYLVMSPTDKVLLNIKIQLFGDRVGFLSGSTPANYQLKDELEEIRGEPEPIHAVVPYRIFTYTKEVRGTEGVIHAEGDKVLQILTSQGRWRDWNVIHCTCGGFCYKCKDCKCSNCQRYRLGIDAQSSNTIS